MNPEGLINEMEQGNWMVNYASYHQYDSGSYPRKIIIENDEVKLRLIVTKWTLE